MALHPVSGFQRRLSLTSPSRRAASSVNAHSWDSRLKEWRVLLETWEVAGQAWDTLGGDGVST